MRVLNDEAKPSIEEALEHYGVLGMKWGVRKDRKTGSNKVTRAVTTIKKVSSDRDASIRKAREDIPKLKKDLKKAKQQHKVDKKEVGRKESRKKNLTPARSELQKAREIATKKTAGEAAVSVISDIVWATKIREIETNQIKSKQRLDHITRQQAKRREEMSKRIAKSRSGS